MAVPNKASNNAAASATKRAQIPRTKATPRKVSATVAAQARNGIVNAGMKELTSAAYSRKCLKLSGPAFSPQIPKRAATADKNAAARANRAYSIAMGSHLSRRFPRIGLEAATRVNGRSLIIRLLWLEPALMEQKAPGRHRKQSRRSILSAPVLGFA